MVAPVNVALWKIAEVDERASAGSAGLEVEERQDRDDEHDEQTEGGVGEPADLRALGDEHVDRQHRHDEGEQSAPVEATRAGRSRLDLGHRCVADQVEREHDRAMEIQKIERQPSTETAISPPNREQKPEPPHEPIDQNDSARCRCLAVVEGLDQRHRRGHHAGRRQALHDPAAHHGGRGQRAVSGRGEHDQHRAGDREPDADLHDQPAAEPVGQAAEHDDEQPGHERGDRDREVGDRGVQAERGLDPGDDVEQGLGEQPEVDDGQHDPQQPPVGGLPDLR